MILRKPFSCFGIYANFNDLGDDSPLEFFELRPLLFFLSTCSSIPMHILFLCFDLFPGAQSSPMRRFPPLLVPT